MTMMTARPQQAPSLREHALRIIRNAITNGDLAEDRIYSAAGLAKQLGVSLSPVREAMMALVAEGTVEAVPNRGFRLVPVTLEDLEEIIRIRSLLAGPAVESLCERARAGHPEVREQLDELRTIAEAALAAAEAEDRSEYMAADRDFHERLLAYGLGRRASAISLRLRDQSRIFVTGAPEIDIDFACQLVDLVGVFEAGDSERARELVVENLHYFKRVEEKLSETS
ncbi:GntR family transcriptional regulator [Brevibacterium sanguinis]|uniref:GntR family transcriptional regulator n=2 Tax=Brevibacterium TaxID=1696 RepID=A0A366INF9_9MICO|nr:MULTISPECIES: GntR family transcriptional regulator [Brevibacterium]RBP67180.1 GntR family transcriptional regulator [Brevibacterium sanguinis]RBP73705.1 GntR family transcriptional regulator [Brevibacterium celere]